MRLQATSHPGHTAAAEAISEFFVTHYSIDAVLLVNSCARGRATRDSCLDMIVLAQPERLRSQFSALEAGWAKFEETNQTIKALEKVGKYSVVHPDFVDGAFAPRERDEAAGPRYGRACSSSQS